MRRMIDIPILGSSLKIDPQGPKGVLSLLTDCSANCERNGGDTYFNVGDNLEAIEREAKKYNFTKVMLRGGCPNGDPWFVSRFKQMVQTRGLEFAWIDWKKISDSAIDPSRDVFGEQFVNYYLMRDRRSGFKLPLKHWNDVRRAEIILPNLIERAEKYRSLNASIEDEKKILDLWPIVRKVKALEFRPDDVLMSCFNQQYVLTSQLMLVVCFSPEYQTCRLIQKKGKSLKLSVVEKNRSGQTFEQFMQNGLIDGFSSSDPLSLYYGETSYSLLTEPGVFTAQQHLTLDPANAAQRFIPLLDRLEERKDLRHELAQIGPVVCEICRTPREKFTEFPVCKPKVEQTTDRSGLW